MLVLPLLARRSVEAVGVRLRSHLSPSMRRVFLRSVAPPAKSSKAFSVTRMMWLSMKGGALARAVLGMLQAAFPFEHGPGVVVILRQLREDAGEVDLPVAERAEAPGPLDPGRIARIDALPPVRVELGVLDVERLDALVIDVDEVEIVELLQQKVRRVVVDGAARMVLQLAEEPLEGRAVEQVFARMDLVADVDADLVIGVEDRLPAPRELAEGLVDQVRPAAAARDRRTARRARRRRSHAASRPRLCEALAASIICSTAHFWRSFGLPCTAGGAKASKASS